MNNNISIATAYDLLKIREIWDEMFPAEKEYQDSIFSEIIPLCTNYIIKASNGNIVSTVSLMPMKFINEEKGITLSGWYMFGVATKSGFEGKGYAYALINHVIAEAQRNNYDFIFERPANQQLIDFYLKFGFTELIKKQKHLFTLNTTQIQPNTNKQSVHTETISERILNNIRNNFNIRFEWTNRELLNALVNLGEIERHNELQTAESLSEKCYIAIKPLKKTDSSIFENAFFCFPME